MPNGFCLTVVRVSALFHYHPLIKFKCSKKPANHQAPALSVEAMLQIVRLSHQACQISYNTSHLTPKQICFERAKLGWITNFLVSKAYQSVCKSVDLCLIYY